MKYGRAEPGYEWIDGVEAATGRSVRSHRPVAGGDIAASFRVELEDGSSLFLKDYAGTRFESSPASGGASQPGPGQAEAEGLAWIRSATRLRVPEVIAWAPAWLALEWIEAAPKRADFASRLGQGLAELHATEAPCFGFETSNWIGGLPQRNDPRTRWAEFLVEVRLRPMLERAERTVGLPRELESLLDTLIQEVPALVGPGEPPSRLHGDLWGGNVISDETGAPCLIDPSVHGGHREVDLAMLALFGGLDAECERAYSDHTPLARGFAERRPLYQVYPLLVHVCLFGHSYCGQLESACRRALRKG